MRRPDSAREDQPVRSNDPHEADPYDERVDPFDEAATARVVIDARGTVTEWSEGARRLLGHRPSEIIGRSAAGLLAEGARARSRTGTLDPAELDPAELDPTALDPAALPDRWSGTVTLLHRNGERLDVRLLAHRRTTDDGATEWFLVSPLTGTVPHAEDRHSEVPHSEVPHSEEPGSEEPGSEEPDFEDPYLLELVFMQSPCPTAVYDTRLRLRHVSEDMERLLGLTEDDVRGLRLPEAMPAPEIDNTERHMLRALETGEPQRLEFSLRLPGRDQEFAWSVSIAPLRDGDGRTRGVVVAVHDMTKQNRAQQRLLLVNEASTRIGSALDVVSTAQELADVAVPALADFVTVDLLPEVSRGGGEAPAGPLPGGVRLRRVACQSIYEGVPEAVVEFGDTSFYPDSSPAAESLFTQRGVMSKVTDASMARWDASDPRRAAKMRAFGFHSQMAVPLRARGAILGVATFSRHRSPAPFELDDLLLAEEITARAAVCIDNARRYTRERDTALALQRSLLPRALPDHAAVEFAFRYLPADTGAGVGGDWFDVIPLSSSRVALVVGDVVGHGVQASATMGRLRTAVRTLADVDLPPDELLTHLDDLVNHLAAEAASGQNPGAAADAAGDVGATCLYAVYDPVSRRCSVARAGHPQPAMVTPDGTVDFLDLPAGPPLGLGNLPFESVDVELREGSVLALFTNGLVESRERGIDESFAALRTALAQPAAPLEDTCDNVLKTLLPSRPADDVALLLARTRALDASQVATWELDGEPAGVAQARRDVAGQLAAWGLEEAVFTTELVVSELVTNAIRYAEGPIQLRLIHDRSLICEVSDGSNTAPHLRRARVFDEGGRGLLLVAQLTQSWGTRQGTGGKTIWAEQSLPVTGI
ncbi:SpoIIE family protein phosphatase [Streptomyces sp. NPDC060131]|uniref:SpoIIE family protein phosphatase n=1 Tax=unclassified Streptomyces TaxID=2593676 RepID=UPI003648345A